MRRSRHTGIRHNRATGIGTLDDEFVAPEGRHVDAATEVTRQLTDAVRQAKMSPLAASIILRTRVFGYSVEDVAREHGSDREWLYKVRSRAEERLFLAAS